jgi:hypothetical protein
VLSSANKICRERMRLAGIILISLFSSYPIAAQSAPVSVVINSSLIGNMTQMVLPFAIALPDNSGNSVHTVTFADLRYCSAASPTHGELIGIVYAGSGKSFISRSIITSTDCTNVLSNVVNRAKSLPNSPAWLAAIKVGIRFKPWQLAFVVEDKAEAHSEGVAVPRVSSLLSSLQKSGTSFKSIETSPLTFTLETGLNLSFEISPTFTNSSVIVTALPTGLVLGSEHSNAAIVLNAYNQPKPSYTNALVLVSHDFIRQIASSYSNRAIPLETAGMKIEIKNLQYSGGVGHINTSGDVSLDSPALQGNVSIDWTGNDLKIDEIKFAPDTLNFVSGTLTTQFKDQLFRPVRVQSPFQFQFGGKDISLRGQILRTTSISSGLLVYASVVLELK